MDSFTYASIVVICGTIFLCSCAFVFGWIVTRDIKSMERKAEK
jgi:hypothetical protein